MYWVKAVTVNKDKWRSLSFSILLPNFSECKVNTWYNVKLSI